MKSGPASGGEIVMRIPGVTSQMRFRLHSLVKTRHYPRQEDIQSSDNVTARVLEQLTNQLRQSQDELVETVVRSSGQLRSSTSRTRTARSSKENGLGSKCTPLSSRP